MNIKRSIARAILGIGVVLIPVAVGVFVWRLIYLLVYDWPATLVATATIFALLGLMHLISWAWENKDKP